MPLRGIRVLDLTQVAPHAPCIRAPCIHALRPRNRVCLCRVLQVLAGPYCTYQLSLLGAEVIKLEPPGGEGGRGSRRNGGVSATFATQGSGKHHIVVDLKAAAGLALALRLAAACDVFVENFSPGVATRLGLGYDAVRASGGGREVGGARARG